MTAVAGRAGLVALVGGTLLLTLARSAEAPSDGAAAAQAGAQPVADVRWVEPGGSDDGDGSRARPWRTLAHAAGQAGPGMTIRVRPGAYRGPVVLRRSGTPGRPIRVVATRRWGARVTATGPGAVGVVAVLGDHVEVRGLDVSGSGGDGSVGIVVEGSDVRVVANRVHDLTVACGGPYGGAGIVAGGGRNRYRNADVRVTANVVADVVGTPTRACPAIHGVYASVPGVRVVNNVVVRVAHTCITSWHAATRLTIANNTVSDCAGHGITIGTGGTGAGAAGHANSLVANNVVLRSALGLVETSDGRRPLGPGNVYLNNLVSGSRERDLALFPSATESGTLLADPRLVRRRPVAGSPVIDAGSATGAPPHDAEGVPRPQGPRPDIGAYEWRGATGG